MDEFLTLNDGTVLQNATVIQSGYNLFFYLHDITMEAAFSLMDDPEKTGRIVATSYGTRAEYTGFTDLRSVTKEDDGMITGRLSKPI